VPTAILTEEATLEGMLATLEGVESRDYNGRFCLAEEEIKVWQGLFLAGNLFDHANSFLILLGDNADRIRRLGGVESSRFDGVKFAYQNNNNAHLNFNADLLKEKFAELKDHTDRLQRHADSLEFRNKQMVRSRGWQILNLLRSLFGRSKLK